MAIIGTRYHKIGHDYDLCAAKYDKLSDDEKAQFEAIEPTDFRRPPLSDEEVKASHTQLMISLGKKEENVMEASGSHYRELSEGVLEVEFTPTFFGDAAKAVPFKNREGEFVSWGFTTDFAPFEQFLWPLFKELVEGTMAVETGITLKRGTPEWEARRKDKALAIKVAKEIGRSFWTTVLATVRVQGWRAPWMLMVLFLILVSYPTCADLFLQALNGGPACNSEIGFIRTVMRLDPTTAGASAPTSGSTMRSGRRSR